MQASRKEITAVGAAAVTGLCAGFAAINPSPVSLVIAGVAGGAWLANVVSRPRPRNLLTYTTPSSNLIDDFDVLCDPDAALNIQPVDDLPPSRMERVALAGRVNTPAAPRMVSDIAMNLTGVLATSPGKLEVLAKLEQGDIIAVSCQGILPGPAKDRIDTQASSLGLGHSDTVLAAERHRSGSFLNLFGTQLVRFGNLRENDLSMDILQRFLNAIQLPKFAGVIPEVLVDFSRIHGRISSEGHVFFGFPSKRQADEFGKQLLPWSHLFTKSGWELNFLR